jgi:hypothetical protein
VRLSRFGLVQRADLYAGEILENATTELKAGDLSVKFTKRRITVQLPSLAQSGKRTIQKDFVQVERDPIEPLEVTAQRAIRKMETLELERIDEGGLTWYRVGG